MKKYTIEVTEEQLNLIASACELSSRLRSGQLHDLEFALNDLTGLQHSQSNTNKLINKLKAECGLEQNESIGIRKSTNKAKKLYEIYYLIKQFFTDSDSISVYTGELLRVTKDKLIIIKEK